MNASRAAIAGLIVSLGIGSHDLRLSSEGLVVEASRVSMGCTYSIVAYAPQVDAAKPVLEQALDEVDRIDRFASLYRKDSALSRLNAAAGTAVRVDPELFDLVAEAMTYSVDSGGAFDMTVGPLLKAWGFFGGAGRVPSPEELAVIRRRVGYHHLSMDRGALTIRADQPGIEIDLGAIAKGYAVDRAVRVLVQGGITAALVSAGGSTIKGIGAPPGAPGWDVAVQDPLDRTRVALRLSLKDRSLSVSGGSEQHFDVKGVRYSHIMDSRTGSPSQGVLAVAALADTGIVSDALGTALYVEGPQRSRSLLNRRRGTEAIFFVPEGKSWRTVHVGAPEQR